jgi:hypothetical protein
VRALEHVRNAALLCASLSGLAWLMATVQCDARDVNTINGRPLCAARACTVMDVRRAWQQAGYRSAIRAAHGVRATDGMPMFWPEKRRGTN